MKKYIKIELVLLLFIVTSCGISEDCFKGNGNRVSQSFPLEDFTKVKVYSGVGLVIKEGSNYEVRVETSDNIIDDLDVKLVDDMLIIKDNSTCNITRDYGQTIVYVTIPDGINDPLITELELYSKTEQKIQSEGTIHSPIVRLFSLGDDGDDGDGAGTGDFYILVNNGQFVVESNNVSNFYINGHSDEMLLNFYFGNGRFNGQSFEVEKIKVFQRGSNDVIVKPIQSIIGAIYATGNVVLENNPPIIEVQEVFSGRVIYN
ncbi:GIN domain-containing protein [Flavobacterium sp.]|uniref:GIN domain-containing protein n=1 Tax=Flavobacterium sp. TaxID=239 RepID=UPI004048BA81